MLSSFSILIYLAFIKFLLHLSVNLTGGYGIFRDELYYLACSDHLAFGYVDHPPLSILLLAINRFLLGDSILAIRFLPALAGAFVVFLTGLIIREMGGKRFAQILGMVSVLVLPGSLGIHSFYSMNVFDHLFWVLSFYILVRILNTGDPKYWLRYGLVAGLGLQNKVSVLFLGFGLVVALLFTSNRKYLANKYFWFSGAIALAIFSPHIIWQISNGWPTLEFIANAKQFKMAEFSPAGFFLAQIRDLNPILFPLWFGGLIYLLFGKGVREYRLFGFMYLALFILFVVQRSKPYYMWPIYPVLFASGSIAWEKFVFKRGWGWLKQATITVVVLFGIWTAPLALPILPVDYFIRYMGAVGIEPDLGENHEMGVLPQHFADMHGWENMVATVAGVYHTLTEEEKAKAAIFAGNYGEAGAIDYYGDKYDLPRAISGHNAYWQWGPGGATGEIVVVLGGEREDLENEFGEVVQMDVVRCLYCMPYENNLPVFICKGLKTPLKELWPKLRHYI